MGIRGLSSFIQQRSEKYLKSHQLHDCQVVIDGSNFLHFMYMSLPRQNASFGGDYNFFADHLREAFRLLAKCKVVPLMIFDGSMDVDDRKQKTRLVRARQKLVASVKCKPSNQDRMCVFPLLLKIVLIEVMREFKIEVIQCQYEADSYIAALARGLKCPVVSNDSDFYVMDVMVIPLSLLELDSSVKCADKPGESALQCKLFVMETFLKGIGHKDASIFPLLGTLLGNDYADKRLFENIFSQIHIPKSKSRSDQHKRLQGLLDWLKGQDVEEAIDKILMCIKKTHHIEVEMAIRTSLRAYEDESNGALNSIPSLREKVINNLIEDGLPEWFAISYTSADFPAWVVEVALAHRMPFKSQVESVRYPSSFSSSSDLLKAISLILFDQQSGQKLQSIWRKSTELVFKRLTITHLDFPIQIPSLSSISTIPINDRRKTLFDLILEGNSGRLFDVLPLKFHLVFASMVHWLRKSSSRIKSYHLDGLILTLIHFTTIEPKIGRLKSLKKIENLMISKPDSIEYLRAAKNSFKLRQTDDRMMSHDVNYDRDVVHVLGEFQASLYFSQTLRRVLNVDDVYLANPASFYNGTFIHQAVGMFKGYDRMVLAAKIYGQDTPLFEMFKKYSEIVMELASSSINEWIPHGPLKPRKRRPKKPKSQSECAQQSSSSEEEEEEDEGVELIGNRFSLLHV